MALVTGAIFVIAGMAKFVAYGWSGQRSVDRRLSKARRERPVIARPRHHTVKVFLQHVTVPNQGDCRRADPI